VRREDWSAKRNLPSEVRAIFPSRTIDQDRPGAEVPPLSTPGPSDSLGLESASRKESIMEFVDERDRQLDGDVGSRDFRFGITGILLIAGIAILLAIIS
jgi:hypothetical protein